MVDRGNQIIAIAVTITFILFVFYHIREQKKEKPNFVNDTIVIFKIDTVYAEKIRTIYKTKTVEKIIKEGKEIKDSSIVKDTLADKVFLEITTYPAIDSIKIKGFIKDTIKTVWKIDSIVVKEYVKESRPFYDNFEYGVIGGLVLAIVLYLIGG